MYLNLVATALPILAAAAFVTFSVLDSRHSQKASTFLRVSIAIAVAWAIGFTIMLIWFFPK